VHRVARYNLALMVVQVIGYDVGNLDLIETAWAPPSRLAGLFFALAGPLLEFRVRPLGCVRRRGKNTG
jgi:hypothetical protein